LSLGERVPKLRFPGFEGEWEEKRIGDIYSERSERPLEEMELLSVTITEGVIPRTDIEWKDNSSEDKSNYKIVRIGDMAYNTMRMWQGACGISSYEGIVSPAYTILIDAALFNHDFMASLFKTECLINNFRKNSQGLTSDTWNLKFPQIATIKIRLPSISEQNKIANLLTLITSRIAAQRKLVELLKKHKRGVIEQIFRQHLGVGKNSEKWNVVELRNLFSKVVRRNKDGRVKNVITNSAEFGLIPQRDFFDKSIAVEGNTDGYYIIHTGDFVYNPRKSTAAPFGPFNRYTGTEDGIISPLYTCLIPNEKADPEYLAWYFRSTAWHRYVYDNGSQGARHDRVNMTDDLLFGIPVLLPPIAVQEKIAKCLNAIDARWSSANKALAYLEDMKRGLLQQLFV
jgi:type I restriction enzyme S subunit